MIARILPSEEWSQLAGTEAEGVWPDLDPENTRVLVVEDGKKIVATWILLRIVHAECLWIAPEHRGSFGVAKRLLRKMREVAGLWRARKLVTGSVSPHVTDLIRRFGGYPMPCESFILPVQMERPTRSDRQLGQAFHKQLETLVVDGLHADDAEHNEQVGRALRTAIEALDPDGAVEGYNEWARSAGYEPIRYLGTVDGKFRADIVTAVIDVDAQYKVAKVEDVCQS